MIKKKLKRLFNKLHLPGQYYPHITAVDHPTLINQAADYFFLSQQQTQAQYQRYLRFHQAKGYEATLGESRTLCFEEAFLVFLTAQHLRPRQVVEIGTQYGKSTRRIVDMLALLELGSPVTCFDIVDQLQFVSHQEVQLILHDVTGDFQESVLTSFSPELIYLDAHPYDLLKNVVAQFIEWSRRRPAILAIHDCSPGLYNPRMRIPRDRPEAISSRTGVWERHALAEVFGAPAAALDDLATPSHRLRVFGTPHGLALLAPHSLWTI
jgi:hypothetical protein